MIMRGHVMIMRFHVMIMKVSCHDYEGVMS